MSDCPFCQIAKGGSPRLVIYQDNEFTVFPTDQPINDGHILIVPNSHQEEILDLNDKTYNSLFKLARKLARALQAEFKAPRVAYLVAGMDVPHMHLHLMPVYHHGDIDPRRLKKLTTEQMNEVAERIKAAIKQ